MTVLADNPIFAEYCRTLTRGRAPLRRVLFIQIPQIILDSFSRDIALNRGYYIFPPTGAQYLFEAVKHRDLEFRILDLNYEILKAVHEVPGFNPADWVSLLERALDEFKPDIVGVSCLFDVGIKPMLTTLRAARARGVPVVIGGGPIATYEYDRLLADDLCHFVVAGEGENKLNFMLDHLTPEANGTIPTPGIYFRTGGNLHQTTGEPDIVVMKGSLVDSYNLVPIETYHRYGSLNPFSRMERTEGGGIAAIQMNRGCRAACTFCAVRDFMGKSVRCRPVDDVLAEMEFLIEKKGVRHFEWLDDDLLFYRKEVKGLFRRIIDKGWPISWSANNGLIAASVDPETLRLMRDSGCIGFKIGIETGNPDMLRTIKKPGTHAKFLSFSAMLGETPEIFVGGNIIVGLPKETFGQMMDSFRFALKIDLDWSAFTICQVIRGASAFSDAGEYFEAQMKSEGRMLSNFIPTRQNAVGRLTGTDDRLHGLDVFRLPTDCVPSPEQMKEIWFAFNLIVNYIHNRNLRPGGRPKKFIAWVETARRAYPTNPYMSLFLALAHTLLENPAEAETLRALTETYAADDYWRGRFAEFGLDGLLTEFPRTPDAVHARLRAIYARITAAFSASEGHWQEIAAAS